MFKHSTHATLPDVTPTLPPLDLGIPAKLQFCVDAGALSACSFFGQMADFNLHDHIAAALHSFMASVAVGAAAMDKHSPSQMQACADAFAAGYLGRIQQELRLFYGEGLRRD